MQSTLLCVLCLLVAVATAQDGGDPFTERNRTRCRESGESLAEDGCRVYCIRRNMTSDAGCPYCNRTCNTTCPQVRCSMACPSGYQRDRNGCQTCNCTRGDELRCNVTVEFLVDRRNCRRDCIMRNEDNCPECDRTCNMTAPTMMDREDCGRNQDCRGGALCLSRGDIGIRRCQNMTDVGGMCETGEEERETETRGGDFDGGDDEEEARALSRAAPISGAHERFVTAVVSSVDTEECREGLRCNDSNGMCEMVTGVCITRRMGGDPDAECDDDGTFRPTQCRRMDGSRMLRCYCVHLNGTRLANSRNYTVSNRESAPDCEIRVSRPCRIMVRGRNYTVQSGDYTVRPTAWGCQRCRCQNGRLRGCSNITRGNCSVIRPPTNSRPMNCSVRGMMIPHGNRRMVGRCNICFCRDGRYACTRLPTCENGTETNDTCRMCRRMRISQVCGHDGRTYHSMCFAMRCAGLWPNQTLPGPCPSLPTCSLYSCPHGSVCLRRGGALCLNREGCRDSDRRSCVNITRLNCRNRDIDESVCGSNGVSYNSTCHMMQDTSGVQVAHARRCNDQQCSGGQVCGTDRVTYNNVCEMRSQSGNARMDHMGRCDEGSQDETPDQMCARVKTSRKCAYTRENCSHRVQPEEGCCPVCGGVVSVAVDRDGLGDYAELDPSVDTLDEFMEKLVRNNVIPRNVSDRCEIQASTTASRNMEIAFSARNRTHAQYCHEQGQDMASRINRNMTRSMQGGNEDESAAIELPPEIEFAAAATFAPLIEDDITPTPGGAPHLVPSLLLLLAAILLSTLF